MELELTAVSNSQLFTSGQACRGKEPVHRCKQLTRTPGLGAGLGAGKGQESSQHEPGVRGAGTSKRTPRGAPADARPRACSDRKKARRRSVAINDHLMKAGSLQVPRLGQLPLSERGTLHTFLYFCL